ncbi:MAG TPA: ArgE/DapE family deacylase [Candidatus Bathyarchaeia archaeon]|nr:ArgE/DapE family deacylase [Candidatus Bathyarchaeia archaeon]
MPSQSTIRQIDRWIDSHKKDLVDLTCRLVRINTTVPPGLNYPKISQVLAGELKDIGIIPSVSYIPEATMRRRVSPELGLKGPRPNTYATFKGDGDGPQILLNGHVDVVPADPLGWSNDPFKPVVKNGKIYGRGSADMKGSDACQILSLRAMVETGAKFHGSITPTFTTDEEIGGYSGVEYLADKKVISKNADYCISTDSGIEALHIASLGDAQFLVTVHGKAAHSGRGWMGTNAIEYGSSLIEEFKKAGEQVAKKRSKIDAEPGWGVKKMRPGIYVNTAIGGLKGNIIPDTFEFLVDRRFIPEENEAQVGREINQVVKAFERKHREVKITIKSFPAYGPMLTPPNHKLIRTMRKIARKVLGWNPPLCGSQGSTDVAAMTQLGIPTAVLGTTRNDSNIHGIDEHVRVNDLVSITKILARTYLELLP